MNSYINSLNRNVINKCLKFFKREFKAFLF
nr:MAG TPA: hypothetical protein [Caudoviricetes sp.]DAR35232.1 MAG TPA: hypothetical protein [Caudoviricetes sp.]DAT61164.1 MAG TPA: hypothetical protein [Caudoviricetes sp.]